MTHLWVRAESRDNEARVGITPDGAAALMAAGHHVTVEESESRCISIADYAARGCATAKAGAWVDAPLDAVVFGLKELPEDGSPLPHRHIMFGHAYKGQPAGKILLARFKAGGGTLLDLEYLTTPNGRRVAAFGYWAGYVGAAVALDCWIAQQQGQIAGPQHAYANVNTLKKELGARFGKVCVTPPKALIIGALGRVGTGASDLCAAMGVPVTPWDMAETASGGPFPEVLAHDIFLNCILAAPSTPVFVPAEALTATRTLTVIGDIACDPDSAFSPVKVYDRVTNWAEPALRVHTDPVLDVMAIDNLPSMLPLESSLDFAGQLLPHLMALDSDADGVWARALDRFTQAT